MGVPNQQQAAASFVAVDDEKAALIVLQPHARQQASRRGLLFALAVVVLSLGYVVVNSPQWLLGSLSASGCSNNANSNSISPDNTVRTGRPQQPLSLSVEETLRRFRQVPDADSAREHLYFYTSFPSLAGTPGSEALAVWTANKFREYGLSDVSLQSYYPLLHYPDQRSLEIVSPSAEQFVAGLREDPILGDDTSRLVEATPAFHGYSADGDVTAELVYANYGRTSDFQGLVDGGVDLRGKLVIVRYGGGVSRGTKVRAAEAFGIAGVIVFSDPADDGSSRGEVGGDPLTPGYPAFKNSTRISREESPVLPKIPSIPISARDAAPFLRSLVGYGLNASAFPATDSWTGGIANLTYWSGPRPNLKVRLFNKGIWTTERPIWNVIAKIRGWQEPDRAVILGNHRDAWVFGATDPHTGSTTLLEVARSLGELLKQGWRPRRTIILGSFDGEEANIIGSTEFVEENQSWLTEQAVAYLNVDGISGTSLGVNSSPSLASLILSVTDSIIDPKSGKPLSAVWNGKIGGIGSGSDYLAFFHHVGIASADLSFNGPEGIYHSNYDDFTWFSRFGDPSFKYIVAAAQLWGSIALRLCEEPVPEFNYANYALQLRTFVNEIEADVAARTLPNGQQGYLRAVSVDLRQAVEALLDVAVKTSDTPAGQIRNRDALFLAERGFLLPNGIEGRPWYRHVVYAPNLDLGYAASSFPSIREPLARGLWDVAEARASDAAAAVRAVVRILSRATSP